MTDLEKVREALCTFIINASKEYAPSYAVEALPEAVRVLVLLVTTVNNVHDQLGHGPAKPLSETPLSCDKEFSQYGL